MKTLNLNQKSETSENEVTFLVRNHVEDKTKKICLPITKNRANNLKKAKKVFLSIVNYFVNFSCFGKEISESLVLYQKVGLDKNGRDKFEKIAGCIVRNGNREIIEFTPETVNS